MSGLGEGEGTLHYGPVPYFSRSQSVSLHEAVCFGPSSGLESDCRWLYRR